MLEYKLNELIMAINSCKSLKEFSSMHRDMNYYIRCKKMTYLYDGIYFYDKEGVAKICKELYGDKYDLSEFLNDGKKYSTSSKHTLIPVLCKKHGRFKTSINDLLSGVGCKKCILDRRNDIKSVFKPRTYKLKEEGNPYGSKRLSKESINNKLCELYGDNIKMFRFTDYKNFASKLLFTCKYHGEFTYNLRSVLGGSGCPYCNLIKKISLILSANSINNYIKDGKVLLDNGVSIGISGCDINVSLTDNVYDILSENKIIYDDSKVKERWKSMPGYSRYKISNLGRVINLSTKKLLSGHGVDKSGYIQKMITILDDDNNMRGFLLHRLVYQTFKGEISSNINIDHIDGNFLNNRLNNLRVCNSIKDNINNSITVLSAKINAYNRSMEKKEVVSHNYNVDSLEGEKWVDLIGMEDLYEVSNLGRIKSKPIPVKCNRNGKEVVINRTPKLLKQRIKSKYLFISLGRTNNRVYLPVHKIVYESFNGKLGDGLEIDHINGNCIDNRLCNLQAVTHTDNLAKRVFNKNNIYNVISKYYDRTISDAKNIANMKSKGFMVCRHTLKKWREKNGIERWHSLKSKKS